MMDSDPLRVLAVDGGGTRCRFAVAGAAAPVVVESGSANAFSDFDGAVGSILQGLDALAEQAGLTATALHALPAFVGLAGVTGPNIAARLASALPLTAARYGDDRLGAVRGALGSRDGVVAHCGTGSFFGAQHEGAARLAGGWGALLGDEASAMWIARRALSAALRAADGFEAMTPLLQKLIEAHEGTDGILTFAKAATPAAIGALAPWVTEAAEAGDDAAIRLMTDGARYISEGADHMGWQPGMALCLTGGIGPCYGPYLPHDKQTALVQPAGTPLDGAIALARDAIQEGADGYR